MHQVAVAAVPVAYHAFPTASASHSQATTASCPAHPRVWAILTGAARWQLGGCRTKPSQLSITHLTLVTIYRICCASVITFGFLCHQATSHVTHPDAVSRSANGEGICRVQGALNPPMDHANHFPLPIVTQNPGPTVAYHCLRWRGCEMCAAKVSRPRQIQPSPALLWPGPGGCPLISHVFPRKERQMRA